MFFNSASMEAAPERERVFSVCHVIPRFVWCMAKEYTFSLGRAATAMTGAAAGMVTAYFVIKMPA